jgi:hypothetical protein
VGILQRNRWRFILVSVLLLIGVTVALQYYDSRYPSWYEDVRLSDGRIIVVHQKREYYDDYGPKDGVVTCAVKNRSVK